MLLPLYRLATHLGGPLIARHVQKRAEHGKEDPERLGERFGRPSVARPDGPLIWLHGASVGEALAALPLIDALLENDPTYHVLVTTGTVTSAELMAERLPKRAIQQFVPVDRGVAWRSFFDFWRPDAGFLIESEIWPNLIIEANARGLPLAIVNGRMSSRSFGRWRQARRTAARLLAGIELCLARSDEDAKRFQTLGANDVRALGDLKQAAPLLPVDENELKTWRRALGERPVWLAASTHPGEEELIIKVHRALAKEVTGLLTMIVPRHPARGDQLPAPSRRRAECGQTITRYDA